MEKTALKFRQLGLQAFFHFVQFDGHGSPYMLIFFQTLSTKGWQVDPAR